MGAGAIGGYVGGLLAARGGVDVVFVGRESLRRAAAEHGLTMRALDGEPVTLPPEAANVATAPAPLADCDIVLVCVKSLQTDEVAATLAGILAPDAIVISLQNGVRNPERLRAGLGDRVVLAGVVGFNVVWREGNDLHRTTSGPLALEASDDPRFATLVAALRRAGVDVETDRDIASRQWTKLLLNLNNAVGALTGAPTRSLVLEPRYRRIVAATMREGAAVLRAAGVPTARMRGIPIGLLARMLSLPTPLVRVLARAQMQIDPEARPSMYQDLTRHRLTEVDYLNGEIVSLADAHGIDAPINRHIVHLVHAAEARSAGSPEMPADELWSEVQRP